MIIDFHSHIFPDKLAARALSQLAEVSKEYYPHTNGTLDGLLASMDKNRIDTCVITHIATKPAQAQAILKWSMEIRSDRIVPLGSVHPDSPGWERELELFAENGFPGIKLHALYQSFHADEERMLSFYKKIRDLGLFVLMHSGYDVAYLEDDNAHPERIVRVLDRVPGLTMIAAHCGGWNSWEDALEHLAGRDMYIDTSFIHEMPEELFARLLEKHSPDKLLFASDSPWTDQGMSLQLVRERIGEKELLWKVLGGNADRLIHKLF